jgi:tetratricopeptide (TPR) repeat protein
MQFNQEPQSMIQLDLDTIMSKLSSGNYQQVLDEASQLLPKAKTRLHRAACHFLIGAALNELGNSDEALPHFLEATLTYPTDQPFLVGHAQLEVSEIQNEKGLNESALFFIDMAISNFDLINEIPGTAEVKEDCNNLREKILTELKTFEQ